ncbi:hypothetical protein MKEN_00762800 [Mycena kentingensis (nom. inval.)]|nr:hypothetical protein MKEN_00762800 [Mycena kentingensis (nom. inval.)]
MLFKAALVLSALTFASAVVGPRYFQLTISRLTLLQPQDIPPPITVTRTFKTITNVAPFIVDATTVFTFTPSPSTSIPFPTGSPINDRN